MEGRSGLPAEIPYAPGKLRVPEHSPGVNLESDAVGLRERRGVADLAVSVGPRNLGSVVKTLYIFAYERVRDTVGLPAANI